MKRIFTLLGIGLMSFYGQSQTALDFDGVDDKVNCGTNINLANSSFTIEFWAKRNNTSTGDSYVIGQGTNASANGYLHIGFRGNDDFTFAFYANDLNVPGLSDLLWHHWAVTYNATTGDRIIYRDGISVANDISVSNYLGNGNLSIGVADFGLTNYDGKVDQVRIWNAARTSSEINANMNSCLTGTETGLIALYDFEDGTGSSSLTDLTSNGNTGTLTNMDPATDWVAGKGCITCPIDQTINTADFSAICSADTTIEVASSELGVSYFLRDNANDSIIAGPIAGTGSAIQFNTGNISSTTTYNVNATVRSGALDFDGVDDYVFCGNFMPTTYTKEAWVYVSNATLENNFVSGSDANGMHALWAPTGNGNRLSAGHNGVWNAVQDPNPLTLNTWIHVAVTYDGVTGEMNLYRNGVLVASNPSVPGFVNGNIVGLGNYSGSGNYSAIAVLGGKMDEVRIWSTVRTATEIQDNMGICLSGNETGLVANYDLNDGVGTVAVDKSINGNNGTLTNGPTWTVGSSNVYCSSCELQLTATPTVTINPIANQTINTAGFSAICSADTTIEIASSELGVNYFLRDNSNDSIIDGPIAGTGSAIQFNTGYISSTTTYNVNATGVTGALDFDGVDDYIDLGNASIFDIQGDITIETWVKIDAYQPGYVRLIGKGNVSSRPYGLWVDSGGQLLWQIFGSPTSINVYGPSLALNTWYHIAATRNGNTCELFVNGMLVSSSTYTGTANLNTDPVTIGDAVSFDYPLNGQMDEVRIWNVARTDAEIKNNMWSCLTGNETGLVVNYDLNDGVGAMAVDKSTNGLDGALTNGPTWAMGVSNATCSTCELEMTATPTITINSIANQTVAITDTELCPTNTGTTVTTASSEVGVNYFLRDNANDAIIAGPIAGTGSGLTFNTGVLTSTMSYNVSSKSTNGISSGLDFDGVDDYVDAGTGINLANSSFSIEFWAKRNVSLGNAGYIIGLGDNLTNNNALHIGFRGNNKFTFAFFGNDLDVNSSFTNTNWNHWAVTFDAVTKERKIYLNGMLVANDVSASNFLGIGTLRVGKANSAPYTEFAGKIDEVRIWSSVRTVSEINANMNTCLTGTETGLMSYYQFEDGTGSSTLSDLTINGNNGTLTNMDPSTDWGEGATVCSYCELELTPTVTVTVQDVLAPVADATTLADATGECSVAMPTAPTATDNCSGSVTGTTTTTFPITTQGTTVVTWTFDDGNGNTSTQMQNIVVDDVTNPIADVATLTTLTDQCSVAMPTAPTATDNCTGSITGTTTTTFPMTSSGTITWTYDDGNGNVITQDQIVTINDNTLPVADVASLTTLTGQCSVAMPTAPTATDNCAGSISGTTTTTFPMTSSGTITWTYDDGNGNVITQDQIVTINDNTVPVPDVANLINSTSECSITLTAPTATDNCVGTITGVADVTFPYTTLGISTITWMYDDGNGNVVTQTQEVDVTDSQAPVADATSLADVSATCEVTTLTAPTATDACSATVTVTNNATLPITMVGTTVVTWTYDDGNGNTSTQMQNVIVLDPNIDVTTSTSGLTISANNTTASSYQWIDCDNNNAAISGETNATFTATANGNYAVVITEGNCSDTSICVQIAGVGIDELSNLGVEIYPNPNNGEFTISTTQNNVTITVYAIDGKIIVNQLQITEANQFINLGDIESGIYFVKVINQTNQKTIRLVIE